MAKQPRITVLQPDPLVPLGRFADWLGETRVRTSLIDLETTDLPALCPGESLATSVGCPIQAFRLGSAHGVQFHPEADLDLVQWWNRSDPARCASYAAATQAHGFATLVRG